MVSFVFAVNPQHSAVPQVSHAESTSGQVTQTMINISNWGYWIYYNGQSAHTPDGRSGGFFPRGTAAAIYQDGFVWGGYFDSNSDGIGDEIRVGGQTYNIGTIPGRVIQGGTYESGTYEIADNSDPSVRVYRIREDYDSLTHAELISDAAELNMVDISSVTKAMTQEIMDQYALDWAEWPVHWGAPYNDLDQDGVYTAGVDEPGMARAEQTAWYVVNDYNSSTTRALYGSDPIGLEFQVCIWAYAYDYERRGYNELNTIYKSYKLINKSERMLNNTYISQWSDPDLGSYVNDYVGCDSVIQMGYAYNGEVTDKDYDYFDLAPGACAYLLLQGPIVSANETDTAWFDFKHRLGYKNMPMTSFAWFAAGSAIQDPELGEYNGTLQFYNMMRGYKPTDDIIHPVPWHFGNDSSKPTTKFPLSGDPLARTGDLDGTEWYYYPGDRRMCLSSGPFDFAPGDTQQVIIALVGGMGYEDNMSSFKNMKDNVCYTRDFFRNRRWEPWEEPPAPPLQGISEVVQLDEPNGAVVDTNLFHSLNYIGDGSQAWHCTAGAPAFYVDSRSRELNGELYNKTFDRFQNWGSSDFEIVFGDSSIAWSYLNDNVLNEKVPFAIYRYDEDGTVRRQFIAIYDEQIDGTAGTWDQGIAATFGVDQGFEEIFAYDNDGTGYQVADEAAYITANDIYAAPSNTGWGSAGNPYDYPQMNFTIIAMYPDDTVGPPTNGTVIRFNTFKSATGTQDIVSLSSFELGQAYPNPFNPRAQIPFTLDESAHTELKVFDLQGKCVSTLINSRLETGKYDINFDGSRLPSGLYIYRLTSGKNVMAGKMTLQK